MALVVLEGVHVDFPIYGAQRSLRHAIFQRATGGVIQREGKRQERIVVRALSDVSMRLEDGDRLGLIGHNGSGKSTLLKVIAGIYKPISGRMTVDGRVTPLLDMMPGLDLDDTGFENLVTAGMLLGLSRQEVERKIPEIEQFSELGEYLTLPVRTYSAGMTLRLGFSLVTALEPGILLMDEGFSTGDLRFAERAAERMNDFVGRSRIIVLASHSDGMIKSMCNKAALLQEGRLHSVGPVDEILDEYHFLVHGARLKSGITAGGPNAKNSSSPLQHEIPIYNEESIRDVGLADRLARTTGAARVVKLTALDTEGQTKWCFQPGQTIRFFAEYEIFKSVPDLTLLFRLYVKGGRESNVWQEAVADIWEVISSVPVEAGHKGTIDVVIPNINLAPGIFFLYVALGRVDRSYFYDVVDANVDLPSLIIEPTGLEMHRQGGLVSITYEFRHQKKVTSINSSTLCAKPVQGVTSALVINDENATVNSDAISFYLRGIFDHEEDLIAAQECVSGGPPNATLQDIELILKRELLNFRELGNASQNARMANAFSIHLKSTEQNRRAYSSSNRENPKAVFWPDPTDQRCKRSIYSEQPFARKIPLIDRSTRIVSAGSCFAMELAYSLQRDGYNYVVTEGNHGRPGSYRFLDGGELPVSSAAWGIIFNTPSFRQLVEKAFGLRNLPKILWTTEIEGKHWYLDPFRENIAFETKEAYEANFQEHIRATREALLSMEIFVITLGLNEVWTFKADGSVFSRSPWRIAPSLVRHRTLTVQENVDDLIRMTEILRAHNSGVQIICSLSPVPLHATFRADESHVVTANAHSKAVLRVAAEEFSRRCSGVYYFPSFEVVTTMSEHPWKADQRHVSAAAVENVMKLFHMIFDKQRSKSMSPRAGNEW
jgi:ABC-type polysaccharide/polyol phosphate transport system ATPase subunit